MKYVCLEYLEFIPQMKMDFFYVLSPNRLISGGEAKESGILGHKTHLFHQW